MSGVIALGWVAAVAASMFFKQMSRLVGRQKVTLWLVLQAAGFLLGGLLVLATLIAFRRPQALIGAVGGLGVGLAIAGLGLLLTTVERRPDGEYYTPNVLVGMAVYAVVLVRFAFRLVVGLQEVGRQAEYVAAGYASGGGSLSQFGTDYWTSGAFFLLAAYTVIYNGGVVLQAWQQPDPAREEQRPTGRWGAY